MRHPTEEQEAPTILKAKDGNSLHSSFFLAGKVINEDIPDIIWEEDCLVWLVAVM